MNGTGFTFKLKNPRKGTETSTVKAKKPVGLGSFKLKNPRKGTETYFFLPKRLQPNPFKLKNPRKGTETYGRCHIQEDHWHFQIKESPEGDWNAASKLVLMGLVLSN